MEPQLFDQSLRRTTGHSICQQILRLRVDQAKALLSTGTVSQEDVAETVGFGSVDHMICVIEQYLDA